MGEEFRRSSPRTNQESNSSAKRRREFPLEDTARTSHHARMIAERIPALSGLTVLEKWTLAAELYEEVERRADEVPVDTEVMAAIESRFAGFESGEATASPWSDVRARILASRK